MVGQGCHNGLKRIPLVTNALGGEMERETGSETACILGGRDRGQILKPCW